MFSGATGPITESDPGAAAGPPKAAASSSTSRRTCSTCCNGFMGEIDEITGCWANLNHPYIEVEDTALAMIRFKNGGLGSIVTSLSQRPGIYTKVHIHGSNGASVGVETDGATFVAGVSEIAEPPLNDLWTIPGEEPRLAEFQAEDRDRFRRGSTRPRITTPCRFRTSCKQGQSAAAGDRGGRTGGGGDVHGDLSVEAGGEGGADGGAGERPA